MSDSPAVPSPAPAAAAKDEKPYRFGWKPGAKFSVDALLVDGYLEGTVEINKELTATFRSLTVEQMQKVESCLDFTKAATYSTKYIMNEMTIAQIYWSIFAINGKALPAVPAEPVKRETDQRGIIIRSLPGIFFDQLTLALTEFDRRCKALITPEAIKNF